MSDPVVTPILESNPILRHRQSYENHDRDFRELVSLDNEKKAHEEHNSDDFKFIYQDDIPHGNALDKYTLNAAVDVGSGTGWFSNYLINHRGYNKVYGIEPSKAAIDIERKIYPDADNVEYINGFAEEEIGKIKLEEPTFFSTMCCLAHHPDVTVKDILKGIDTIAPVGSVLSSSDPWGDTYSRECWYIRPPEWWSDNLPDWEFEFYTDYELTDPPGRNKGFTAIKL